MSKIVIEKDKIVPLYEKNHSINQTAKELDISWGVCKRILQEYEVPLISHSNQYGAYQQLSLFNKIQTEADAYWLGILYSDGWIRSDRNSIGLGSVDRDLIEKFKDYTGTTNTILVKSAKTLIGKSLPEGRKVKTAKDFYSLEFSSKATKENLIRLGCVPKKSLILTCPNEQQVSTKLLWHFLRGYIDGDGWIIYNTETNRYSVGMLGTKQFLEEITQRLKINHYGHIRKKNNTKNTYEFSITKRTLVEKMLEQLYHDATVYMDRKYKKYVEYIGRSSI